MIGRRFAQYEIKSELGRGGMGRVYRAHDHQLDRDVALKILSADLITDPESLGRLRREARALAALDHPHIATVHGFEQFDEVQVLVLELVHGRPLSKVVQEGPLSLQRVLRLGAQVARALATAHAHGIVHRDLKPENVMLTTSGDAKILDFGLAKCRPRTSFEASESESATTTVEATRTGLIMGTTPYMSPEQARGEAVDHRTDIWALGCMLYEMLTGRRAFDGRSVPDVLSAILNVDPDWDALPRDTPIALRRLLRRCLERDPQRRLHAAADAALDLEEAPTEADSPGTTSPSSGRSSWPRIAAAALAVVVPLAVWLVLPGEHEQRDPPTHLSIALPDSLQLVSRDRLPLGLARPAIDISADGGLVVCVVERSDETVLYRRFLDEATGEVVPGTEGAYSPQISPDGDEISFFAHEMLKRVDARGDRVTSVASLPSSVGHCWTGSDEILATRREGREMMRVDVRRGVVTKVPRLRGHWPFLVRTVDAVLVNDWASPTPIVATADPVYLFSLDGSRQEQVGASGTTPRLYRDEVLLTVRNGALMASAFALDDPTRTVESQPVLEGLLVENHIGQYALSDEGTLVYAQGGWLYGKTFVWDDGEGEIEELGFPPRDYQNFELSPDGRRMAVTVCDPAPDVWIYDLDRGSRLLLTTDGSGYRPVWSPDGARVAFTRESHGAEKRYSLQIQTVGSTSAPEVILRSPIRVYPFVWHGKSGLFVNVDGSTRIARLDPDDPPDAVDGLETLVASGAAEWGPDVSPDGRWLAYSSDESGQYEVYVTSLVTDSRSWTVSVNGGVEPIWSTDGRALFFRNGGRFLRTPVIEAGEDGARFRVGEPEVVVEGPYVDVPGISYDVGPEDRRLLLLRAEGGTERTRHLNVILNWDEKLRSVLAAR